MAGPPRGPVSSETFSKLLWPVRPVKPYSRKTRKARKAVAPVRPVMPVRLGLLPREEYNIFYGSPCTERASLKASFAAIGCPQSVRKILSMKDTEFRVDSHGRFSEKNASTHVLRIQQ